MVKKGIVDELDRLNAAPVFVPGSLTVISIPAGADDSNTDANGGTAGTGLLDVRGLSLNGVCESFQIVFEVQLAGAIANNTIVLNQSEAIYAGNTVAVSDDPNINGPADPFVGGDEDPTEILIQSAFADGTLSQEEYGVLEKVAKPLGFRRRDLDYLISMYEAEIRFRQRGGQRTHSTGGNRQGQRGQHQAYSEQQSLDDAYRILGVAPSDDEKVVKRAYRKRMAEHHPDKLVSKGLPEQAMEIAKKKAQDIQSAYELIKQKRGF